MTKIEKAITLLKHGGVVGIPTETVYGLAASVESSEGIDKIFSTKERPFFDPLIVHVGSIDQAKNYVKSWPKVCDILAEKFWPGPVTFILPKNNHISDKISSGLETVGIRMPNHPQTLELINKLGHPIAAPSANKFKKTSPTCAQDVEAEFQNIFVIDGGPCDIGIESTILGFDDSKISVYRPGMVTKSQIEEILSINGINLDVLNVESPVAPGHLKHHYMPKTPVITTLNNLSEHNDIEEVPKELLSTIQTWLLPEDPVIAARLLYSKFREFDQKNISSIIVQISQTQLEDEHFDGILNRLKKASTFILPKNLSNKS